MANDIVNPYQVWRDLKGTPAAGGYLRIYVNRTTTLGTAFSDDALTIAQSVDPYSLDNYGRTQGDLKWSGLRTVELYDSNDNYIRTYNDVATLVDTSEFAINLASVAAMVAETSLEIGDIVETQSYNADQNEGGARYIIVATATGTDDGYIYHDLDNGLQAELLDQEENKNFYVAGAVGDRVTDDTVPVQALLSIGGEIECSNGEFRASGLTLSESARIAGNGSLVLEQFATADLLALSGEDLFISFVGVTIDGDQENQTSENSLASISSTLTTLGTSVITFAGVTFQNGNFRDVEAVGDDAATAPLYAFSACNFLGGAQSSDTPYLPAYVSLGDGVNGLFDGCYYDLDEDPNTNAGRGGVLYDSSTVVNPGWLSVVDTTFNRIGAVGDDNGSLAAVHVRDAAQVTISKNRFISPNYGAIAWGAEVDVVQVTENGVEGLAGDQLLAQIGSLTSLLATPGSNWDISGNILEDSGGVAISLDGSTTGTDVENVSVISNVIDSPTLQAILVHNIDTLQIDQNNIDMATIASVNAIEINTDGVSGEVSISFNQIVDVNGTAVLNGVTSTANFTLDGNIIDAVVDAIDIQDTTQVVVVNNQLNEVSGDLVNLGTLTTGRVRGNTYTGTAPTNYTVDNGSITDLFVSDNAWEESGVRDLASAATLDIISDFHVVTDNTNTITDATFAADFTGQIVVIMAGAANVTINQGNNWLIDGNWVGATVGDTLTVIWSGTQFRELSRTLQ